MSSKTGGSLELVWRQPQSHMKRRLTKREENVSDACPLIPCLGLLRLAFGSCFAPDEARVCPATNLRRILNYGIASNLQAASLIETAFMSHAANPAGASPPRTPLD